MTVFVISYDLNRQKDYSRLYDAIKGISGLWLHPVDSTWYVKSTNSAGEIAVYLGKFVDTDDVLLVSQVGNTAWTRALPVAYSDWLRANL